MRGEPDAGQSGVDAFHAGLGSAEIGRASLPGGKTVRYMQRMLSVDVGDGGSGVG